MQTRKKKKRRRCAENDKDEEQRLKKKQKCEDEVGDKERKLECAIRRGIVSKVQSLLEQSVTPPSNALELALDSGHLDVFCSLLKHPNVKVSLEYSNELFCYSVLKNRLDFFKVLLQDSRFFTSSMLLEAIVELDRVAFFSVLPDHYFCVSYTEAFSYAVRRHKMEMLKLLITRIAISDSFLHRLSIMTVKLDHLDSFSLLLTQNRRTPVTIHQLDRYLFEACSKNRLSFVQYFCQTYDVCPTDRKTLETRFSLYFSDPSPLQVAVENGNVAIVSYLLHRSDPEKDDCDAFTSAFLSCQSTSLEALYKHDNDLFLPSGELFQTHFLFRLYLHDEFAFCQRRRKLVSTLLLKGRFRSFCFSDERFMKSYKVEVSRIQSLLFKLKTTLECFLISDLAQMVLQYRDFDLL
jgi:hypothetical protein